MKGFSREQLQYIMRQIPSSKTFNQVFEIYKTLSEYGKLMISDDGYTIKKLE